ncbi:MAG TPA: hypothetical protein VFB12_19350 [Ktedonobacteraceae bacterium]|nr:hypothetical protein [Ktedonobacteraceae bacterium]
MAARHPRRLILNLRDLTPSRVMDGVEGASGRKSVLIRATRVAFASRCEEPNEKASDWRRIRPSRGRHEH